MTIDWQEWRDHFLLHSLENVEDVLYFWKHSTVRGWRARFPVVGGWGAVQASLGFRLPRSREQIKDEALVLSSCIWGFRILGTPLGHFCYLIGALQTCLKDLWGWFVGTQQSLTLEGPKDLLEVGRELWSRSSVPECQSPRI
jgi:hypothetical protein